MGGSMPDTMPHGMTVVLRSFDGLLQEIQGGLEKDTSCWISVSAWEDFRSKLG